MDNVESRVAHTSLLTRIQDRASFHARHLPWAKCLTQLMHVRAFWYAVYYDNVQSVHNRRVIIDIYSANVHYILLR